MRIAVIGIAACLASATVVAQDTDTPVRAGTPGVSHPRIVQISSPFYPLIAQSARVQGNVIIEASSTEQVAWPPQQSRGRFHCWTRRRLTLYGVGNSNRRSRTVAQFDSRRQPLYSSSSSMRWLPYRYQDSRRLILECHPTSPLSMTPPVRPW